jgi:hypothetical protein
MLAVIMLSVIMLAVIMLSVMLNVSGNDLDELQKKFYSIDT